MSPTACSSAGGGAAAAAAVAANSARSEIENATGGDEPKNFAEQFEEENDVVPDIVRTEKNDILREGIQNEKEVSALKMPGF